MKQTSEIAIEKALVSVVMPAYNCEEYIDKAINSILNQSYKNIELLICDDASTDKTWEKIQNYKDPRITALSNSSNKGYLHSINLLLSHCQGEFIGFQDADDWSLPNRLYEQISLLNAKKKIKLCGTFCTKYFDDKTQVSNKYPVTHREITKALAHGRTSLFCGATMVFRRSLLEEIGRFRTFYDRIGAEDIDWYIRAVEKFETENLAKPLYYYRQHEYSVTKKANTNPLSRLSIDISYAFHLQRKHFGSDFSGISQSDMIKYLGKIIDEYQTRAASLTSDSAGKIHRRLLKLFNNPIVLTLVSWRRRRLAQKIVTLLGDPKRLSNEPS